MNKGYEMTNITPAQDKAVKAFGADGVFPKGTRAATIEGIRAAGLIVSLENDGTWDLTGDGREYLGLAPIAGTQTTDEILAELNTNPWDVVPTLPDGWTMSKRNRDAWRGLSQEEITEDIATARTVANRKDRRSGNVAPTKHMHV